MNESKNNNETAAIGNTLLASPRTRPCLCVCCPSCGAVFMATALSKEYHNDSENNKKLLDELADYAKQGYAVSFKDAKEFKLDYCEHLKAVKA